MTQILQNPTDYSAELVAWAGSAVKAMRSFHEAVVTEPNLRRMPREWVKDVETAIRARYSPKLRSLIEAVKAHATANYEKDGWDLVVETMTDDEIAEKLKHDMWTVKQAIRIVGDSVKDYAEYRDEIKSTEW